MTEVKELENVQTNRVLVVGESGSGKSHLVARLVREYLDQQRTRYVVVVSPDAPAHSPLSQLCAQRMELSDARAAQRLQWGRMVADARTLYVEVTAMTDPRLPEGKAAHRAIGELSEACMELRDTLLVFDEAPETVPDQADVRTLRLWRQGRKYGVDLVAVTQGLLQRNGTRMSATVRDRSNLYAVFNVTDPNELAPIGRMVPALAPHLSTLRTPMDGGAPEFGVYRDRNRAELVLRSGTQPLGQAQQGEE